LPCAKRTCARNNAGSRRTELDLGFLLILVFILVIVVVVVVFTVFVVIVVIFVVVIWSELQRRHATDIQILPTLFAD